RGPPPARRTALSSRGRSSRRSASGHHSRNPSLLAPLTRLLDLDSNLVIFAAHGHRFGLPAWRIGHEGKERGRKALIHQPLPPPAALLRVLLGQEPIDDARVPAQVDAVLAIAVGQLGQERRLDE